MVPPRFGNWMKSPPVVLAIKIAYKKELATIKEESEEIAASTKTPEAEEVIGKPVQFPLEYNSTMAWVVPVACDVVAATSTF